MHRFLFNFGPITIYSYGAMLALAFLAGTYIACIKAKKSGIDINIIIDLVFYILFASIAGARIFFVAMNLRYYLSNPVDIFKVWEGGLVFYGGLAGGFMAALIFLKKKKQSVWKIADMLSGPLALGISLGRIGCFLNGCCYGSISHRFGVCFPSRYNPPVFSQQLSDGLINEGAAFSLPVVPTQLFEAAACVAIYIILALIEKRKRPDGFIFWCFVLLYSVFRFMVEWVRYYDANFFIGPLTVSQLISIALFMTAAIFVSRRSGRWPKNPI